jgi:AraC-like DNA-binding protein
MHNELALEKPPFTAENIAVLNVIRDRDYTHSYRTGRPKHGFIYVASGAICHRFFSGQTHTLAAGAGELMFIPQGSIYSSTYLEDGTELKIVQFDLSSGALPAYLESPTLLQLPDAGKLVGAFFRPGSAHPFNLLRCFYDLLWQVDENHARVPGKYARLLTALTAMSESYSENEPISHYAALCGMSESNFRRLFREYTGVSPVDHRNALRLSAARAKLQSGEYNVSEAALSSGFTNLSFFIRLYKKKYGHTPKKE